MFNTRFWRRRIDKIGEQAEQVVETDVLEAAATLEYEETKFAAWWYRVLRKVLGPIVRGLFIREIEGLHHLPKEGALIVASNHESYLDFLCFTAISPRKVHYLAAEKFWKSKIWKALVGLTGQIRVDRNHPDKSRVYAQVYSALKQGRAIGIFPEGTRSADGKLQKAYTGVAKFAIQAQVPIVPVGVSGAHEVWSRHRRAPKLKKIIRIQVGKPLSFSKYYGKELTEKDYRAITDKIMLAIAGLTGEEYGHHIEERQAVDEITID